VHVRATGEATPAGWEPGKKTLKPSPELAGKVCEIWSPEMAFWGEEKILGEGAGAVGPCPLSQPHKGDGRRAWWEPGYLVSQLSMIRCFSLATDY